MILASSETMVRIVAIVVAFLAIRAIATIGSRIQS